MNAIQPKTNSESSPISQFIPITIEDSYIKKIMKCQFVKYKNTIYIRKSADCVKCLLCQYSYRKQYFDDSGNE